MFGLIPKKEQFFKRFKDMTENTTEGVKPAISGVGLSKKYTQ